MEALKTDYVRLFEKVKNTGHIHGIALDVFGIVCAKPGLTVGEIYREYAALSPHKTRSRGELSKRVSDLMNWGAIEKAGTTICPESGRKAERWVPTGTAPNRFQLKLATRQVLENTSERLAYYQALIAKLGTDNDLLKESNNILARDLSNTTSEVQGLRDSLTRKQNDLQVLQVKLENVRSEKQSLVAQSSAMSYENHKARCQLQALADRSRFILRLPKLFTTKRLRRQAQETLTALETAIKAVS